jgi:hypothetical protein
MACLAHERMTSSGRMQKAKIGIPSSGPHDERLYGGPYLTDRKEKRSVISVTCKVNKLSYCKMCSKKPFLYPDMCFELYHTVRSCKLLYV